MNPTLFMSHGAPNLIFQKCPSIKNFSKLEYLQNDAKYIIVISAHWVTNDLRMTNANVNEQIYDFYGFERQLYNFKYKIQNSNEATSNVYEHLSKNYRISIDNTRKGFDHGVWSILSVMFKNLKIPVVQLSLPISYTPNQLVELGKSLKELSKEALIICSGGITHNLYDMIPEINAPAHAHVKDFNDYIVKNVEDGNLQNIINLIGEKNLRHIHPSLEHFLPLFVALGASKDYKGKSINSEIQYGAISMESFIFKG